MAMTATDTRLWCCHRCKMIGSGFQAGRHVDATGHPVEQLSQEISDAVRDYQEERREVNIVAYMDFHRGPPQ